MYTLFKELGISRSKLFLFFICIFFIGTVLVAEEFPLRAKYTDLKPILLEDLAKEYESILIVDVRSKFEFDVIHIKKAAHISISKATFASQLEAQVKGNKNAKIAFYCNGHTCAKSYKAAKKAKELGYTNGLVFDAGIFEWTTAHADKSFLLGESPADIAKIIPKPKFKEKCLSKDEFAKGAVKASAFVIDARDPMQREKTPDYALKAAKFPMDKLVQTLDNAAFKDKTKGKTLYIIDAVGKQVKWLQYHLENKGYTSYFFLEKGVWSIYGDKGANK